MQLIQYNSTALFAGPAEAVSTHDDTTIIQLRGIQSASFDFGEPLADVESMDGNFERLHLAPPDVNLKFSYFVRDGWNERCIGLGIDGTGGSFVNFFNDERNYFVAMRNDKMDILSYSGYDSTVLAFAQGCLTSYGVQCGVGKSMTANVSLAFLNVGMALSGYEIQLPVVNKQNGTIIYSFGLDSYGYTGSGDTPLVDYPASNISNLFSGSGSETDYTGSSDSFNFTGSGDTTDYSSLDTTYKIPFVSDDNIPPIAIGPGDIILSIPEDDTFTVLVSGNDACIIQDFDISVALVRLEDRPLGYMYPRNRKLDPPIELRLTANAYVNKYKAGMMNERLCDNTGHSIEFQVTQRCNGNRIIRYRFDGLHLDSSSFSEGVGQYQNVTLNWSSKIFNINQTGSNYPNFIISTG